MHPPIFVREVSDPERPQLGISLRAPNAFTLRRAQILLASAAGHRPRQIARSLGCAPQTVRNAIHAFNATGLAALSAEPSRPKSAVPVLNGAKREQLHALLHQSPRAFGLARSTWTLSLLARVAHEQGLSPTVLSIETIRQALRRLKVRWRGAKHWLTSSDPAYTRKKPTRPADRTGREPTGLDAWRCG
jgi:transposase